MLFFLYGQDNFRSLERLNRLKADFIKTYDPKGQNIFILEPEDFTAVQLKTQLASTGLFSQSKMIVVKNLLSQVLTEGQTEPENILKILDNRLDDNINLIFCESTAPDKRNKLFKKLAQLSCRNNQENDPEYKLLPPWQIKQWVNNYLKNFNFKIESLAIDYLTAFCGADLWRLKNEADKLMMVRHILPAAISPAAKNNNTAIQENASQSVKLATKAPVDRLIDFNLIKQLLADKIDDNIFHLTDALSNKNINQALNLLEQQLSFRLDPFYIFSMLVRQFRILLKIKDGENKYAPSVLANQIGEHPFVVSKGLDQVKHFSQKELLDIYQKLLETDLKMKSSNLDPKAILTEFVLSI